MKKQTLLLIASLLVLVSLFAFSNWTNAMVISGAELSPALDTFSDLSPLLAGVFILAILALLILASIG